MKLNTVEVGFGGGSLLQLANRVGNPMMSYFIETPEGKTVIIDGGHPEAEDALYLHELIMEHGGVVDLWLMTHSHSDHYGGLLWMLENIKPLDFTVKELRYSFPPLSWQKIISRDWEYAYAERFYAAIEESGLEVLPLNRGLLECGGMTFEVLNDLEYLDYHEINDTSIVFQAHFPKRSVLFLGDLAVQGGEALLRTCPKEKLRCDIVEMAHHGQGGVDKAFYEVVQPKICLYNAPGWLYDCDNGGGKGSGPWKTLETRRWMEELGAEMDCPVAYGDYLLR